MLVMFLLNFHSISLKKKLVNYIEQKLKINFFESIFYYYVIVIKNYFKNYVNDTNLYLRISFKISYFIKLLFFHFPYNE